MSCRTSRKRRSNESTNVPNENRFLKPSPTTLTKSTMDAVAIDQRGVRLSRSQRDNVEKFRVWAFIGDTKAVAVRPRTSLAEQRVAQHLLGCPVAA